MSDYKPLPARRPRKPKKYPVLSLKSVMEIINEQCGNVYVRERHGKGRNKVILLPEAYAELRAITSYGRRSPMNVNEQKLCGLGHFMVDEKGNVITIGSHFIEIQTMNRSPVGASNLGPNGEYNHGLDFLEYHMAEFLKYESKYNTDSEGRTVDPFIEICGPSVFTIEGHTHPDLGVFYSETDKISGAARAAVSPICIFVCDPVRQEMLGSTGKGFSETEVIALAHRDDREDLHEEIHEEEVTADKRLIPPTDEVARLAKECLLARGYSGSIKLRTRLDGKGCLKIKLVIPKPRRAEGNES